MESPVDTGHTCATPVHLEEQYVTKVSQNKSIWSQLACPVGQGYTSCHVCMSCLSHADMLLAAGDM